MLFCCFESWQKRIIIWGNDIFRDKNEEFGFEDVKLGIRNSEWMYLCLLLGQSPCCLPLSIRAHSSHYFPGQVLPRHPRSFLQAYTPDRVFLKQLLSSCIIKPSKCSIIHLSNAHQPGSSLIMRPFLFYSSPFQKLYIYKLNSFVEWNHQPIPVKLSFICWITMSIS